MNEVSGVASEYANPISNDNRGLGTPIISTQANGNGGTPAMRDVAVDYPSANLSQIEVETTNQTVVGQTSTRVGPNAPYRHPV